MADTEWGSMTEEQRSAELASGFAQIAEARKLDAQTHDATKTETIVDPGISDDDEDGSVAAGAGSAGEVQPAAQQKTETIPASGEVTPAASDAASTGEAKPAAGKGNEAQDWRDQSARDIAAALKLTDDEFSGFASREEFDRALRIIDRKAFEAAKAPPKPAEEKPGQQAQQQQGGAPGDPFSNPDAFKWGEDVKDEYRKPHNEFVDVMVSEVRKLRDELGSFRQAQQRGEQVRLQVKENESIDALDMPELFGKKGERLTSEQTANRQRLKEAGRILATGLRAAGKPIDEPTPEFLGRAANMEFAKELDKIRQQKLTEAVRKQGRRVMGGSATRQLTKPKSADIRDNPDIDRLYNELVAQNG